MRDFRLRKVLTPEKDAAQSSKDLADFVNNLRAENGLAPVEIAIDKSIEMLSQPGQYEGFQAFMLSGDVGPYEDNWGPAMFFDPSELENEHRIINKLKLWVQGSPRRKIISMFSGVEPKRSSDYYNERLSTFQASQRFFQAIASETGQPGNFTDNPATMLAHLLNAIIEER
jgi:hypothetical protein